LLIDFSVLGATGTGKTTFVNLASNSSLQVGMGLSSCTNDVQISAPFKVGGKRVVLVDTPGFDDTNKSDIETMQTILQFLAEM
jgi:predicted GTPase